MTAAARTLPFGAEPLANGRVSFRVWAPSAREAAVVLELGRERPMQAEGDGWFCAEIDCAIGERYRYRFDGGEPVPDPASRAQAGGVAGASVVVDPGAYRWRHPHWRGRPWRESVIYELHVGACGGYAGVRRLLPELQALGATVIELMPVAEFGGTRNWGYDGVLPFAPSAAYGAPGELKALVDEAHGLGLSMMLDVVYNHFGPVGNFLDRYAGAFFRDDVATPWGRAIDFRRAQVRAFVLANARYWLDEYRFDGLRLDAVHAITPSDWLVDAAAELRANGRHVHLVVENDANAAHLLERGFDAQWNDDFHHVMHVLLTGERDGYYVDYAERPAEDLARALAEGFVYQGRHSRHRDAPRGEASAHLPPTAFVNFLQNHDQVGNRAFGERLAALARPEALHAATALLLLAPSIPLLWMGQEWGCRTPFLYFTDHASPLAEAVRDGRRREFAGAAGFAAERIPDPNDAATFVASLPDFQRARTGDGAVEAERCRRLLAIRRRDLVPHLEATRSLGARALGDAAVCARWQLGPHRLALFAQFGDAPLAVDEAAAGEVLYETPDGAAAALAHGTLPPHGFVALLERHGEP